MSVAEMTRIVLEGGMWLRDWSVYLQCRVGKDTLDYLYELQTEDVMTAQPDQWDRPVWNVFESQGKVSNRCKRNRKLKWSDLTFPQARDAIHKDILSNRTGYVVVGRPEWFPPVPAPELPTFPESTLVIPKNTREYEKLDEAYLGGYGLQPIPNLFFHRAFFFSHSVMQGHVRFIWGKQEDTRGMALLSSAPWMPLKEFVHEMHGTVLEGSIHPAATAFKTLQSEDPLQAQRDQGTLTYVVSDCLAVKGTPILEAPFQKRFRYAQEITKRWQSMLGNRASLLQVAPLIKDSGQILQERAKNLTEDNPVHLRKLDAPYTDAWGWLCEMPTAHYLVRIGGYEDAKSGEWAKGQWISKIILHDKDGKVIGKTGIMEEAVRRYISENRARVMGAVVEVTAHAKTSKGLSHPRFIAFRPDMNPDACL